MPELIVAGTGHRFVTLPTESQAKRLAGGLEVTLWQILCEWFDEHKPDHFIGGGALGFDMIATEVAWSRRVPYTLALPYMGYDKRWSTDDRARLLELISGASRVHWVSGPGHADYKYTRRNKWMVDQANCMLALWDGKPEGGTASTVMYAWSRRKQVENFWRKFVKHSERNSL